MYFHTLGPQLDGGYCEVSLGGGGRPRALGGHVWAVRGHFVALLFYEKLSCVYIYFIVQKKNWALGQEKVGKSPRRAWQIRKIKLSLMRRLST